MKCNKALEGRSLLMSDDDALEWILGWHKLRGYKNH